MTEPAAGARGPLEIELKYDVVELAAAEALLAAPALGPFTVGPERATVETEDRYIDTADRRLLAGGFVARLRRSGGRTLVTVKSATTRVGAEHRRLELEAEATDALDPWAWPDSPAARVVRELVGGPDAAAGGTEGGGAPLVELGLVRQRRRPHDLTAPDGTRVELTLDAVEVLADGAPILAFHELEAEYRGGDETTLAALAAALDGAPGLAPAVGSKMERALRATEAHRAAAAGARGLPKLPGVTGADLLGEAGRKVLRLQLDRLIAHEPAARSGDGSEDLHKMRVATRRMRAAWRFFGPGFDERTTRRLRKPLSRLGDALGEVRDRDVLLEALAAETAADPGLGAGLAPLVAALAAERDAARAALLAELDSPAHADWREGIERFVRTPGVGLATLPASAPARVRETAASALWSAYEQVRAYETVVAFADVPTLHRLRIGAKRLRYGLEFLREALPAEGVAALLAPLVALQDRLGAMNDAHVAAGIARDLVARAAWTLTTDERAAIERWAEGREAEVERLRDGLDEVWAAVAGPGFRATLGAVAAAP